MRALLRSLVGVSVLGLLFDSDASVHFCARFCSKPSISPQICLFYKFAKFSTILASIVGYDCKMQKNKTLCSVIVQSGIGDSSNCRIAYCKTQKNIRNGLGDYDAACLLGNVEEARRNSCHVASRLSRH